MKSLDRVLIGFLGVSVAAALAGSGMACGAKLDVHDTDEAKSNACIHCHTSAYIAATNPVHEGLFPETCEDCHESKKAWVPVPELHTLDAVTKKTCVECHQKDYDATTQPVHKDRKFPTDCKDCHSTETYQPLPKDIHSTQTFGKQTCYDCHQGNYESTTSPNHVQSNYPKECASCHNIGGAWVPTKTGG